MFADAYDVAKGFTRPVVLSERTIDSKISCSIGSFIVVNKDGWIVTAAHMIEPMGRLAVHLHERAEYDKKLADIRQNAGLSPSQRKRQLNGLTRKSEWVQNQSYWWAMQDMASGPEFHVDILADVAIGRLLNFDTSGIPNFPVFKKPTENPRLGSSLCRLGFPFHVVEATYDVANNKFEMQNFSPPPMFPNDGIHTRVLELANEGGRAARFIETSTLGLRGQSGGPLFDTKGEIWGVQSKTAHLELGFNPKNEHQFMNVGLATHVSHVIDMFTQFGVNYQSA